MVKGLTCSMIWRPYTDKKTKISRHSDGRLVWQQDEGSPPGDLYAGTALLGAIDLELCDNTTDRAQARKRRRRGTDTDCRRQFTLLQSWVLDVYGTGKLD